MLQEITRSVTLTYHPFFKSLLAGFESLSLLNRCLTQLHLRNKVTADPSSSVQTPLKQNKNTPSQLPFSITLAFCGQKKKTQQPEVLNTSRALDIWHRRRCLPRDYFKSGFGGTEGARALRVFAHPQTAAPGAPPGGVPRERPPGTGCLCPLAAGNKERGRVGPCWMQVL